MVDPGPFHLPQELAGVGGEGLHVAALALFENRVEGEGRFTGTAEAGDDGKGIVRDIQVDVLEVVFARAANGYLAQVSLSGPGSKPGRHPHISG